MNLRILVPGKTDEADRTLPLGGRLGFRRAIRNNHQVTIVFVDEVVALPQIQAMRLNGSSETLNAGKPKYVDKTGKGLL